MTASIEPDALDQRLRERLQALEVRIRDDRHAHAGHAGAREGGHYAVLIRSERFAGLSRPQRHRLVYDAVADWMGAGIHALQIQALAPDDPLPPPV